MPRAARWIVVAPLVAALALLSAWASHKAGASVALEAPAREMDTWSASGFPPGAETWGWIHDEVARVASTDPGNPNAQERLGTLGAVRMDNAEVAAESLEAIRQALVLRPVSPFPWAAYADALYRRGDTGKTFEAALERAVTLGPAEPGVQYRVALYGLAVYDEINESTRRAVDRAVAAGLRRDPQEVMTIAQRRGRLDIACRLLAGNEARSVQTRAQYCKEREATP